METDATCKTCRWCSQPTGESEYGRCRALPPGSGGTMFPLVVPDVDWCREHPDRKEGGQNGQH